MSNAETPEKAIELHQQARKLGSEGEYAEAIKLLKEAQSLAPDWPYPPYDMAFTYLLQQDFGNALKFYKKTVALAPRGFFTAITAVDSLDREAAGDLPEGIYAAYVSLEWVSDPAQKSRMVNALNQHVPQFAPAWKELALLCEDPNEKLAAFEKGLETNPDPETKGLLLINKALTLNGEGDIDTAREILEAVIDNSETTFANEQFAKQTLAMVNEQDN